MTRTAKTALDQYQQERIESALEHGQRLYRIKLRLHKDLDKRGISPIAFFSKIQSIGQILESHSDVSEIRDLDDVLKSDIEYTFLFTTVLEKNLVALALEIPEDRIQELNVNIKPNKYKELLLEDKQLEKTEKQESKPETQSSKPQVQNKRASTLAIEDSIRVPIDLLNHIMNLASELVLGRNQLLRVLEAYRKR